jgi:hypothetical protein
VNYQPGPVPVLPIDIPRYLSQELQRISAALKDNAITVFYRTSVDTETSLSAGDSANYKVGLTANIIRISTSNTVTITGLADTTPFRERTFINVGTGVLVLKNQGTESSASYRFALGSNYDLSADHTATVWYDPASSRHRGIGRT